MAPGRPRAPWPLQSGHALPAAVAHLCEIEAWLPPADRSRLLPVWRLAGWLTGEVAQRDEAAAARGAGEPGVALRAWGWLVGVGSRGAVAVCRHL